MADRAYHEEWAAKHPGAKRGYNRIYRKQIRAAVLAFLGGCCSRCGFSDPRALQVDHVNGGGYTHRKGKSGLNIYLDVLKDRGGPYQLLCANCNWIKRDENNEHAPSK